MMRVRGSSSSLSSGLSDDVAFQMSTTSLHPSSLHAKHITYFPESAAAWSVGATW